MKRIEQKLKFNNPTSLIYNRIVAFGGSFNPPTIAHYELLKKVITYRPLKIILIPNGDDYSFDDIDKNLATFFHRKKMCELLFTNLNFNNFEISQIESSHEFLGTYQTLRTLNHPTFIIGDDCLFSLKRWKNYETLVEENNFVIFTRRALIKDLKNYILNDDFFSKYLDHFAFIKINLSNISSTAYRNTHDKCYLTNEINDYIFKNNLFEVNNDE